MNLQKPILASPEPPESAFSVLGFEDRGGPSTFHSLSRQYLAWLASRGQSPTTLKLVETSFVVFGRLVGVPEDVRAVRREDIQRFAKAALGRYAHASARHFIWRVKHFFGWLARRGRILIDPAASLDVPRRQKRLVGPIPTIEEIERLFAALELEKPSRRRDRAAYEVMYGSGLRIGEVRQLSFQDLDFDRREIFVRAGKGGKDRVAPMTGSAALWLGRYLADVRPRFETSKSGDRVFISSQGGRPLGEATIRLGLGKLARRAGILKRVTPHALRRAFASHLLLSGAPPMIVKELLGHSEVRTIDRYIAVAPVDLMQTFKRTHPRA